jgi:hypothetical protein
LSFGVRSAAVTSYSEFYNPPSLIPLSEFTAPISNSDLIGLLTAPQPLQPVSISQLFIAQRYYTANASLAVSRPINGRDTLSFTAGASLNHTLNFGQETGPLYNYQSSGGSASMSLGHRLTPKSAVAFSLNEIMVFGANSGSTRAQEQSAQVTYTYTPWRRLSFSAGGGPAVEEASGTSSGFTWAGSAAVSFTPWTGSTITSGYSRSLDPNGFSGGTQANRINLSWSAPQPHGHKWRYGLTTNFYLGNSIGTNQATPGQYATGAGISLTASFIYPVTRALLFTSSYGYLFQSVTNVAINNSSSLANYQRHIASMGFHYSFGLQGASSPASIGTGH